MTMAYLLGWFLLAYSAIPVGCGIDGGYLGLSWDQLIYWLQTIYPLDQSPWGKKNGKALFEENLSHYEVPVTT